ncbi:MAG TPA: hypothetical protein VJY62_09110 [Bacteroidia bacterium]|nr:hypothetical protein [Bacteroidia bacterium]
MLKERTYLRDIKNQLQYKDTRSVNRWCKNHNVTIFSDYGARKKYVLNFEFTNALTIQSFQYCIEKYGTDKLAKLLSISVNTISLKKEQNSITYLPQGEHEKTCLARLHKIINELPSSTDGKSIVYSENEEMERVNSILL